MENKTFYYGYSSKSFHFILEIKAVYKNSVKSSVKLYRLAFLVFGIFFIALPQLKYFALSSGVADLGFFISNFSTVLQEWQRAFHGHVQLSMLLIGFGYKLVPSFFGPMAILLAQSALLLWSVHLITRSYGRIPGFALLMYPPLWANNLFDFHLDFLAVPILTLFFITCKGGKYNRAIILAGSLTLIKEPFALQTIACGMYLLWIAYCKRSQKPFFSLAFKSLLLILFGVGAFSLMVNWLIPFFGDSKQFAIGLGAYSWLGTSYLDILATIILNPLVVLKNIFFVPEKLFFLTVCFCPLLFISILRPAALIVAIPPLSISLLSSFQNHYGYGNHYTAGIIIPLIISFASGLRVAKSILFNFISLDPIRTKKLITNYFNAGIILVIFVFHILFGMSPISRLFVMNKVPAFGWSSYIVDSRDGMIKAAIKKNIPEDKDVIVSSQNSINWYLLASRPRYMPFPIGVTAPYNTIDWGGKTIYDFFKFLSKNEHETKLIVRPLYANYIIIDLKRPYFIGDIGCEWIFGECQNKKNEQEFLDAVNYALSKGVIIFQDDGFFIIKSNTQK